MYQLGVKNTYRKEDMKLKKPKKKESKHIIEKDQNKQRTSMDNENINIKINNRESDNKKGINKNIYTNTFKIMLVILISLVLTILLAWVSVGQTDSEYIVIEIEEGDSLWKIASEYRQENTDLRKIIYKIKRINRMDSVLLSPGQKLKIP
ncbi:MAG: cell division suppressor protein YneA, partial [Bacillota bacterium]